MGLARSINRRLNRIYFSLRGMDLGKNATIHRSVDVIFPRRARVGKNSTLYKHISLYVGGSGIFEMGSNSHIAPFGYLLIDKNTCTIGDHVAIGPFCTFICHSNSVNGEKEYFTQNYTDGDIKIGNNVFIGAQCTILPGTIVEDNVVVAANSVVKGRLEGGFIYGGSPVKKINSIQS